MAYPLSVGPAKAEARLSQPFGVFNVVYGQSHDGAARTFQDGKHWASAISFANDFLPGWGVNLLLHH